MRIALATSQASAGPRPDDAMLSDALEHVGMAAEIVDWRSSRDWGSYDVVVIRSTWNYHDHHAEFLGWIDDVASRTQLLNPPDVAKPNTVKTYFRTLEAAGLPVVPTRWVTSRDLDDLPTNEDIVVKPSVGATGSGLRRFETSDGLHDHVMSLLHLGDVMIQTFLPSVADIGETSAIFIGGQFTHAVHKVAREGEFRVQSEFGGSYSLSTLHPEGIGIAERAIDTLSEGHDTLAYARVDLVLDDRGALLIGEVELVEPELFLALHPPAARALAAHIASHLR